MTTDTNRAHDESSALQKALAGVSVDRGKRASHQVYEVIRKAIVTLRLEPNQPLSEQEVGSILSLSRTPVREAFIRLAEEGLLTSYPQLSTVVSPVRMEAIYEAQFLREAVEGAVAARAALVVDGVGIARLREILSAHEASLAAEDWALFYDLDDQTHRVIGEIAGLTGAQKHLEPARAQLDRMRQVVLPERETSIRVIDQHRAVIDAICLHDADLARAKMAFHTRDILTRLPDLQARRPELFESRPATRNGTRR